MVLCMTGIGSWSVPFAQCVDLASQPGCAQQWRRCKHLIIDEISMVNTTYFDKLEAVARAVRKKENIPFGGIQLILSGDQKVLFSGKKLWSIDISSKDWAIKFYTSHCHEILFNLWLFIAIISGRKLEWLCWNNQNVRVGR